MIRILIKMYMAVIVLDAVMSFFPQMRYNPWVVTVRQWADYGLRPIRKHLPGDVPFDPSPLILILILNLIIVLW